MAREWLLCINYATKIIAASLQPRYRLPMMRIPSINAHKRFIMPSLLRIFQLPRRMMGPALTAAMPLADSITGARLHLHGSGPRTRAPAGWGGIYLFEDGGALAYATMR